MDHAIVTVTLNPAIDETVFLDELRPGSVNRARHHHCQAGGKGVNVSAMLGGYGIASTATGFLGEQNPGRFEDLFAARLTRDAFVRVAGETRSGIKIISESIRETTDINFPGFHLTEADLSALEHRLLELVAPNRWFVVAGSLPVGVPIAYFEKLLSLLKQKGARIAVDTSGPALQAAIDCGVDLIKPNHHELEEILGYELPDYASRVAAAIELQREKVPHVVLSLGADGALFVSPDGSFTAAAPPVKVVSTVGAGDSLLAGYLAGRVSGLPSAACARLAAVFAWSALEDVSRQPPTRALAAERMARIEVRELAD